MEVLPGVATKFHRKGSSSLMPGGGQQREHRVVDTDSAAKQSAKK